jgi:maleamate amidohydrolase
MSDALRDSYAAAFGGKAGFGTSPALILIDFVEAYFASDSPFYAGVESALASALRVREAAVAAGVPVILTNVVYHRDGFDGGRFFEKVPALKLFLEGSPLGSWAQGLSPRSNEIVVSKQYPSIFFGTSLASMLTAGGIDQVILTGLSTSGCVRASCVDAVSHGFRTAVVADACGDRHPGPHEANLFDMGVKYADVVSEKEIVVYLSSQGVAK